MTRKIRDEPAKRLGDKPHTERIAFYREQVKKMEEKLPALLSQLAMVSGEKGQLFQRSP